MRKTDFSVLRSAFLICFSITFSDIVPVPRIPGKSQTVHGLHITGLSPPRHPSGQRHCWSIIICNNRHGLYSVPITVLLANGNTLAAFFAVHFMRKLVRAGGLGAFAARLGLLLTYLCLGIQLSKNIRQIFNA